ncbi:hypothetical protein ILYODFUR_023915 [Ilyodon furcidens]|uniref:Uncharacterized protein n=1 Tax=Ilyodon furcidens TaxID=33524 RepID=A0ABV0TAK9_9TELE
MYVELKLYFGEGGGGDVVEWMDQWKDWTLPLRSISILRLLFTFFWTDYLGPSRPTFLLSIPLLSHPASDPFTPETLTPSPSQTFAWCQCFFFVFLLYMEHNKNGSNFYRTTCLVVLFF